MPKTLEDLLYGMDSILDGASGYDTSHIDDEDTDFDDDEIANICNEEYIYD